MEQQETPSATPNPRDALHALMDVTVERLISSDVFVNKLADAIALRLNGEIPVRLPETYPTEPYWEVAFTDEPKNDESFRVFIYGGEGTVTPADLKAIDATGKDVELREDVALAVCQAQARERLPRGQVYWATLYRIEPTKTPADSEDPVVE